MTHERKGNFLKHGEMWLYRGEKEQWEEEYEEEAEGGSTEGRKMLGRMSLI